MNIPAVPHIGLTRIVGIFLVLFVVAFTLFAQSGTTGISGTVTDPNGASIPGATVVITNAETGYTRTVLSDGDGKYSFPGIPAATYRLEVRAASFKKLVNHDVAVLVDSPIVVNAPLEAGDVSAVVDVTSNNVESIVNTQDASLGNNFQPQQIVQLPTDLRRVSDLLTLQPAVTREGYVAGGRSDQSNILLDGVDINDQQNGGRTVQFQTSQDTVLRSTTESVQEFRITTSNPNANLGRSSGAQISLVTKSGTNSFRGAAFYFYRPTAFSANTFFNNLDGVPRPSLARNIFGGALGGPIKHDKLFFFYSYEGQRETLGDSVCRTVPFASMGQGKLNFVGRLPGEPSTTPVHPITLTTAQLNSIYSSVLINPAAVAVFANASSKYTANSDCAGDGVNTGGFRWNAPTTIAENTHIARFDWNAAKNQTVFLRGNYQADLVTGGAAFPDTSAGRTWEHPYGFVVGHDWAISGTKINNFRYGLTRQAFSIQGDSNENAISFRNVFSPVNFSRTLNRITPTHNISDDFTWIKGSHTIQFGENVRIIRNIRTDYGNAFDNAITNNSFYDNSGRVVSDAFAAAGYTIGPGYRSIVQNAATALIGRFSQYSGNFTFDRAGNAVAAGTPTNRKFATEEYDSYVQDSWKVYRNLTLTLGLRYGLDRPVYEANGFQVVTKESLGSFFERRKASAAAGRPLNDLISFEKGGPANKGPGYYKMDWRNFQPSLAAAWSPNFKSGFLKNIFGGEGKSVFRGGFRILSDHFGEQLAVSFNALSTIGYTETTTIAANTYNVTTRPAPLFTGFGQQIRNLPGIPPPVQRFTTDVTPGCLAGTEDCPQRIESSLDRSIVTPKHYTWNVSWGRQFPKGMYVEMSYIGRKARHLLAAEDVNALNNIVDPQSAMDWYGAAGLLNSLRTANRPINSVAPIPYFEHLFPGLANAFGLGGTTSTQEIYGLAAHSGFDIQDWTFIQSIIDDLGIYPNMFFHPQYAAFSSFGSYAKSNYHGATVSLRQRLGETLSYDINYTFSESFDNASGLQSGTSYGSQFILNSLRPQDNYAPSDFDTRHSINANFILQIPIGRHRKFFSDTGRYAEAIVGGWQLAGIFRYNTGLPISAPFDANQWATNWNVQSNGVRIAPVRFTNDRSTQRAFSSADALNAFRNAAPGETGERNIFRQPGYSTLDVGLSKSFAMPWRENHKLQFRWEVFNVLNSQTFNADNFTTETFGLPQDAQEATAPADFGKIYSSIQGNPRRMQFGLRYSF
ncbi:MAG: carboxypeptidase regulatory-like domain-containing protein [Pyrinomonadaceae bacterium]